MNKLSRILILFVTVFIFQLSCTTYRGEIYNENSPCYPDNQYQELLQLNSIHNFLLAHQLSEYYQNLSINNSDYTVISNGKDSTYLISRDTIIADKYYNCVFKNKNCYETHIISTKAVSDSLFSMDTLKTLFNPMGEALDYFEFLKNGVAYRSSPSPATAEKYNISPGINFSFFYYPDTPKEVRDSLKAAFVHIREFPQPGVKNAP